ncbi:MAG: hypothetical protein ACOZAK_01380 [Patescibacteria group bacterium]
MSTIPPRTIISNFSKPGPTKTANQSRLQQLTNRHQHHLQNNTKKTQKDLNQLTERKQRIDRTIPITKQPLQTHLKGVSNYLGQQANNLRAKVNGKSN